MVCKYFLRFFRYFLHRKKSARKGAFYLLEKTLHNWNFPTQRMHEDADQAHRKLPENPMQPCIDNEGEFRRKAVQHIYHKHLG